MAIDSLNEAIINAMKLVGSFFTKMENLSTKIIINGKATILIIGDKKTVVKCTDDEEFDIEKGIAMALLKHAGLTRGDMARLIKSVDNQNDK